MNDTSTIVCDLISGYLCIYLGVKACLKAKEHVPEQQYEVTVDIHGIRDGPRLGRHRLIHKVG